MEVYINKNYPGQSKQTVVKVCPVEAITGYTLPYKQKRLEILQILLHSSYYRLNRLHNTGSVILQYFNS